MPLHLFVTRETGQFLAGFAAGEVWLLDLHDGERYKVGEAGSKLEVLVSGVTLFSCLGKILFVGEKRSTKQPLQVFQFVSGQEPTPLYVTPSSKLRGIAAIFPLDQHQVLVACGRGIGKAHVWLFKFGTGTKEIVEQRFLGSMSARSNTITMMKFCRQGRTLLTVTTEKIIQSWALDEYIDWETMQATTPFELRAGQSSKVDWTLETIGEQLADFGAARAMMDEFDRLSVMEPSTLDWLHDVRGAKGEADWDDWKRLFPARLLDPAAYDGQVDSEGQPHGFGSKLLDANGNVLYEGEWRHGLRHGRGQLIDERTGNVLYSGGWKNNVRHGFGKEVKASGEVYSGWWKNDMRHGIAVLKLSAAESRVPGEESNQRIRYVGFFKDGVKHGLGWWIWPRGSQAIPFAVTLGAMDHLGSISCITQFKNGAFFNEFNFHRTDGLPLSAHDKDLFNFSRVRKDTFSAHPDGRCELSECWACMDQTPPSLSNTLEDLHRENFDESELSKHFLTCNNESCGMRVHRECLGQAARKLFLNELCNRFFCDDESEEELVQLKSLQFPPNVWYCPAQRCQKKAMASKPVLESIENSMKTSTSLPCADQPFEEQTEPQKSTPNDKRHKSKKKGNKKRDKKRSHETSPSSSRLRRKKENCDREGELGKVEQALKQSRILQHRPSKASLDCDRLLYISGQGDECVVETDSDLEEALEEIKLRRQSMLTLYRF